MGNKWRWGAVILMCLFSTIFYHTIITKEPTKHEDRYFYYENAIGECGEGKRVCYPYLAVKIIGIPLSLAGPYGMNIAFTFLIFLIPSIILFHKTNSLSMPVIWNLSNAPHMLAMGFYPQFLAGASIMAFFLYPGLALVAILAATQSHRLGALLGAVAIAGRWIYSRKEFSSKLIFKMLLAINIIAYIGVALNTNTFYILEQSLYTMFYLSCALLPILAVSIYGQETRKANLALSLYLLFLLSALWVEYESNGSDLYTFYFNFHRVIGMLEMMAITMLALGKHGGREAKLAYTLCLVHFAIYGCFYLRFTLGWS